MQKLTTAQRAVLETLKDCPSGWYRSRSHVAARELEALGLIVEHAETVGGGYAKLTDAGRAAIEEAPKRVRLNRSQRSILERVGAGVPDALHGAVDVKRAGLKTLNALYQMGLITVACRWTNLTDAGREALGQLRHKQADSTGVYRRAHKGEPRSPEECV